MRISIVSPECPKCGCTSFSYDVDYIEDDTCVATAECNECDCEYELTFKCVEVSERE